MMLGRVAYRGSFSLRSAVTTAGSLTLICSRPPSTSRITFNSSPSFSTLEANVAYKKSQEGERERETDRQTDRGRGRENKILNREHNVDNFMVNQSITYLHTNHTAVAYHVSLIKSSISFPLLHDVAQPSPQTTTPAPPPPPPPPLWAGVHATSLQS